MLLPCHIHFSHVYLNVWSALDSCHIFRIKFHYAVLLLSCFTCDLSSSRNAASYTCSSETGQMGKSRQEDWIAQPLGAAHANSIVACINFFLQTGRKSFAQDGLPSLILHLCWRLDPLLNWERAGLPLLPGGGITGRPQRTVLKWFDLALCQLPAEMKSFELCLPGVNASA